MQQWLPRPVIHLAIGSAMILGAHGLADLLDRFIQPESVFDIFGTFKLIYLPHGVQILLTWVYGWMVVPIVLPAALLATYLVVGPEAFGPSMLLVAALKVVTTPLTFDLFRMAGVDARGQAMALNWKVLFLIGLLASVFNNLLRFGLACCGELSSRELLLGYTGSIIGDMIGVTVVMLGAMAFSRALRG
jgi:hypothetical protein